MKLFRIDVQLAGTVYVKAVDKTQAKRLADQWITDQFFEFEGEGISGAMYDSPHLPLISLSPAFTGKGVYPDEIPEEVD